MITINLRSIKDQDPCKSGWKTIKKARGGKLAEMDAQFPLASVLDANGLNDTLWCLQCLPEHSTLWRKYAVWCARQVENLMTDERSKAALDVAWRHSEGEATDEELAAAEAAAWYAARAAALDAAAHAAARAAALAAAARAAALDAAREKQEAKLRQILNAGAWVDDDPSEEDEKA